jgi:membrane protease YdiL (CAAX protease family)
MPSIYLVSIITQLLLKDMATPQTLVTLFSKVAKNGDYVSVGKIVLTGALLAPISEEFLFRGFFYGVWKRYIGPVGAAILASLLFAAMHTSLSSFPGLFLLAMCLTLVYERTGSLLVPIVFHATFNFTSLVVLFLHARNPSLPIPT